MAKTIKILVDRNMKFFEAQAFDVSKLIVDEKTPVPVKYKDKQICSAHVYKTKDKRVYATMKPLQKAYVDLYPAICYDYNSNKLLSINLYDKPNVDFGIKKISEQINKQ